MRTFIVVKKYPFSKFSVGEEIQFIDDIDQLKTKERELFDIMEDNPEFFREKLDTEYYVKMWKGYALSVGEADTYQGKIESFGKGPVKSFNDEDEALMFYAKNTRLFSFEDINKLPLEASHLEFFMQTIKKLVNENKSTNQENS